jgi:site-specific DNA recombinase
MCVEGMGFKGIADELNRRSILSPRGNLWCFTTIKSLLENPVYRGDIVWNRRTESKFFACRGQRADRMKPMGESGRVANMPSDDWIVIENATPAIVDRETWDRAQVMVRRRFEGKAATASRRTDGYSAASCAAASAGLPSGASASTRATSRGASR